MEAWQDEIRSICFANPAASKGTDKVSICKNCEQIPTLRWDADIHTGRSYNLSTNNLSYLA